MSLEAWPNDENSLFGSYTAVDCRSVFSRVLNTKVMLLSCGALDLRDKQAEQSSTNGGYIAKHAIDGGQNSISVTVAEVKPWWRVDLGEAYCLKQISLKVRVDCCANRLDQATVRAGFSTDHYLNRFIGPRVSINASGLGALLPFVPSPLVTARYVSVNHDKTSIKIVAMAEVMVDELLDTDTEAEVTEEGLDFTVVIHPPVVGQGEIVIGAYKGCRDITANVSFGRQLTTGGNQSGLPGQSSQVDDIYYGRATRLLLLPDLDGNDRVGVFYSEASKNQSTTRIQAIILPNDDANVHTVPVYRTLTTSIGEAVSLQMLNKTSNTTYRWKHNGDAIDAWNNQLTVSIPSVVQSDEGIYSCFVDGQEDQQRHGIMRLIVRGCAAGMWGPPSCSLFCTQCHNGGVCDDVTGTCVCAPGFSGENCEQSHGRHVFGKNAERSCSDNIDPHHTDCQGRLFCLRDPYGCSCAAGYKGLDCMPECDEGTYGVDCKQTCRCVDGQTCLKDTGQCSGGESLVVSLAVTSQGPRQLSATWLPDRCFTIGYFVNVTDTASSLVIVGEQYINNTEESVLVSGLEPFTEYLVHVAGNTSEGPGPYGDGVTVRTDESEPTAPLNVTITTAYRSALIVEWIEPNTPNGIIINYDITFWRVDVSSPTTVLTDIQPGSNLIYQIINLPIGSTYSIQVRAKTSVGAGPWSDVINGTTQSEAFEFVTNLHSMDRTDRTVTLQWDLTSNIQGQIRSYMVAYKALEKPHQPSYTTPDEYLGAEVEVVPYSLGGLEPGTKYEIRVSVLAEDSAEGAAVLQVYTRPHLDPPAPLPPITYPDVSTLSTVTISLNTDRFDDAYIVSYVVHVKKTASPSATKRDVVQSLHYVDSPYDYIAAEFLKQSVPEGFVVGDGETYGGYYNAPLAMNTDYEIRVGAFSKGNGTEVSVTYSEPVSITVQGVESCDGRGGGRGGVNTALIVLVIVFGVGVLLLSISVIVVSLLYRRNRSRPSLNTVADGRVASQFVRKVDSASIELQPCSDSSLWTAKCDIAWEDLTIDRSFIVGKGRFTVVRRGSVKIKGKITQAAIKNLKDDVPKNAIDVLVREFLTMRMIGPHPNIVAMLGACSNDGALYVATEYLAKGILRTFLRSRRLIQLRRQQSNKEGDRPLTSSNLLQFGVDVAKGMEHLSKSGIIHRDLCAGNILLGTDMTAKIADLGLADGDRHTQQSDRRIATRWLAIESLTLNIHVCRSDVWSFGILLWEIVTFGGTPYPDTESKHLASQLMNGYRLPKPENCSDKLYDLMLKCWQLQPKDRPSFEDIGKDLQQLITESETNSKSPPPISSPTIYEEFSFIDPELDDR
ncbi:angiopoietin-1 receptor-like [Asterias rubens]|uniref:angiopoietin-1 receptor-like n=1 Tax=Asterias rubens TaxID=7604 RepID=UPI001455690F|nr:angiopoietin-1 receptor-like [Asterias rubens]